MPVVLVVDDGAANRELIRMFLSTIDCDVRLAADGVTALEMIEADPPDLVLLDVRMPHMDGYEVCRRIKAMPRGKLLPVVMITGLSQTRHRVAALEAGADDFMAKPVDGAELTARVRSELRLKELYNTLDGAEHVIFSLATAVEAKDSFTERHTQRVGESARLLGQRFGLADTWRSVKASSSRSAPPMVSCRSSGTTMSASMGAVIRTACAHARSRASPASFPFATLSTPSSTTGPTAPGGRLRKRWPCCAQAPAPSGTRRPSTCWRASCPQSSTWALRKAAEDAGPSPSERDERYRPGLELRRP